MSTLKSFMKMALVSALLTSSLYAAPVDDVIKTAKKQLKEYQPPKGNPRAQKEGPFNAISKALNEVASADELKAAEFLVKIVNSKRGDAAIRGAAMRALSSMSSAEVVSYLQKQVGGGKCTPQLVDALFRMKKAGGENAFVSHLKHKSVYNQRAALRGLGYIGGYSRYTVEKIHKMLTKADLQGQRWACCEALGGALERSAMEPLIEALDMEGSARDARKALIRLTGVDKEYSSSAWSGWFAKNPQFTPVDELAKAERILASEGAQSDFYGLVIEGGRIVFLLDGSLSMKGKPWEALKVESAQMLTNLNDGVEFAIVFFPLQAFPKKGYVMSGESGSVEFVNDLELKWGTPIADASYYTFKNTMKEDKLVADVIYLLTDGQPTDMKGDGEMDAALLAMYPGDSVRIHSINLGGASGKSMLDVIAKEHGGTYVRPGKKKKKGNN